AAWAASLSAALVVAPLGACEPEPDGSDDASLLPEPQQPRAQGTPASTDPPSWNPVPQGPWESLCQENQAISPPPEDGVCQVEVRLIRTEFASGQGISEGRGEISFDVSAEPTDGLPPAMSSASVDERRYNVGQRQHHRIDLGTYPVEVNTSRFVEVCVDFVEHDEGGVNGGDDLASDCATIMLQCTPSGAPATEVPMGPIDFCGDSVCRGSASATIETLPADADMDGVDNDHDFTPEMCDEYNKGEEGIGALVYFHFEDDGLEGLVQAVGTHLAAIYREYDYVVLVADNETSNPMGIKAPAFSGADAVYPPTRAGLLDAMRDLTANGMRFDHYTWAHGYKAGDSDSTYDVLSGGRISGQWLIDATQPSEIGTARGGIPQMAWWSSTCIAARQIDAWTTIGGLAAGGATDVYFYPTSFGAYFNDWIGGVPYRLAAESSHTPTAVAFAEYAVNYLGGQAPWECVSDDPATPDIYHDGPGVVSGLNACADDFFNDDVGPNDAKYNISDVYTVGLSGSDNMAISSTRQFAGNDNLTFGAPGLGWP
ncbi:MAG: hypothetical protein AAF721_40085, partial [Myxococcota bacterium]